MHHGPARAANNLDLLDHGHPDVVYGALTGSRDARVATFATYAGALSSESQSTRHAAVR